MNTKWFSTYEEVESFVTPMMPANAFWIKEVEHGGGFEVKWIENKTYTAFDGKTYHDDVWVTEQQELISIQDLTDAHAKNIIRLLLRNQRESKKQWDELLTVLADQYVDDSSEISETNELNNELPGGHVTLH